MEEFKLTEFSPGAGCGCKIAPADLEEILKSEVKQYISPKLLVGNESKDDAAVFDIGNNTAIISTTDFFTPIVDDPFDFGRIAATNAISDIYAMGGTPIMAIAILGWPLAKLPKETARIVIEGARNICSLANITLAGGHSIDISDPVFGLAVTGIANSNRIKQNNKAEKGCKIYLTKPIGIGIVTTAEKKGIVKKEHIKKAIELMTTLNSFGSKLGELPYIKAMTDVTGFGLLGHLLEMCEPAGLSAQIQYAKVPIMDGIDEYIAAKSFPGGTFRNWKSYGNKIGPITEEQQHVLCDPQTSGGLLLAVEPQHENDLLSIARENNVSVYAIGEFVSNTAGTPYIEVF